MFIFNIQEKNREVECVGSRMYVHY